MPNTELLLRLAVLIKQADPTGKAANTPTFKALSVLIVDELMDTSNHAKYLKLQKEVESEFRQAAPRNDVPASLQQPGNVTRLPAAAQA